jgi:peptidylprolyl isomerase
MGLANGAVSDPIRLDDGWHIIRLIDTKAAYTRQLAEVRDQLAQRIREERASANRRAYLAKLIEQSPPVINELALSHLLEKTGK